MPRDPGPRPESGERNPEANTHTQSTRHAPFVYLRAQRVVTRFLQLRVRHSLGLAPHTHIKINASCGWVRIPSPTHVESAAPHGARAVAYNMSRGATPVARALDVRTRIRIRTRTAAHRSPMQFRKRRWNERPPAASPKLPDPLPLAGPRQAHASPDIPMPSQRPQVAPHDNRRSVTSRWRGWCGWCG